MFATIKQIFDAKNKDLRKRIGFTFLMLFIFKLGTVIVVPGIDESQLTGTLGFLELLNTLGGGALENYSIFALGVGPYITASIVIQILQLDIIPYLTELKKQGQVGRVKINKITSVASIIFAFIQGYLFSVVKIHGLQPIEYIEVALILTAGTALLLFIGNQITQKGVGNGVSLIIMAGIIASLPTMFVTAFNSLIDTSTTQTLALGIVSFVIFVLIYLVVLVGIIFEQNAERRIPIQYANKSASAYGGRQSYMPFKLNSAGVVPVIFASAVISLPGLIVNFINKDEITLFVQKWLSLTSVSGFILYMILIIAFTYFYTFSVTIKTEEMAENLNKNGGYIPGVRPGEETKKYVDKVLKRITFVGALSLAFIAGLPIVFGIITSLPSTVTVGGTGLLIVVGVALETYRQVESTLLSRNYRGKRK
ncbi:MAG: preprotein translocase subunit SecY [Bacilli bacterium]|nr:preprotein translocase subunit SecY [Bacilli bacterium]MDD4734094.1 preprotein translocase subunit SecY [Bacilli bacterium]